MPPFPQAKPDLSKFKKAPAPDLGQFKKQKPSFRYDVPAEVETREQKMARLNAEALTAQAEMKKANSLGGFIGNFNTAVRDTILPAPVALGKTIGKILDDPSKKLVPLQQLQEAQRTTQRLIKEREARGEDTTALKRGYNNNVAQIDELNKDIKGYGASLPKTSEVVGQLAGTALDTLSAGTYGKTATAGMKTGEFATGKLLPTAVNRLRATPAPAQGLFSAPTLGRVAQGAGTGYAYDVASGLQGLRGEDRKDAKALIPGIGTAIGGGIPLALGAEKSVLLRTTKKGKEELAQKQMQNIIGRRAKDLDKLDAKSTLRGAVIKGNERGIDIKKVLSETDTLAGSVDDTGLITTRGPGEAIEVYTQKYIDGNESKVSEVLRKEGRSISPETIRAKLESAVRKSGISGKELKTALANVDDEIAGLALGSPTPSGAIPLEAVHQAKIDKYSDIKFNTEASVSKYKRAVAKALKEIVEAETTSADVRGINKELSKHFAVIDYLTRLDGKKVSGGAFGKVASQFLGAAIGSHFGPLGTIGGAELAGKMKGADLAGTFGGKTGLEVPEAPAFTSANEYLNRKPLGLPASSTYKSPVITLPARSQSAIDAQEIARVQAQLPQSLKSLGSRQMSQATTIIPTKKAIPKSVAPKKKK